MFFTKDIQWQVAITAIVTVKEPDFLISMEWVICRIDIQNDLGRGRIMGLKKKVNQEIVHTRRVSHNLLVATRRIGIQWR
jgi:hypothetical protein